MTPNKTCKHGWGGINGNGIMQCQLCVEETNKQDWETEFEKFMQEWMYSLKTENSYYALEKRMKNFISELLSTQEEKIIEHIIKCIETDPEIKIPRSYDASWILTNLQFHKKVGEHQSPWFSKDNNL